MATLRFRMLLYFLWQGTCSSELSALEEKTYKQHLAKEFTKRRISSLYLARNQCTKIDHALFRCHRKVDVQVTWWRVKVSCHIGIVKKEFKVS